MGTVCENECKRKKIFQGKEINQLPLSTTLRKRGPGGGRVFIQLQLSSTGNWGLPPTIQQGEHFTSKENYFES